MLPFLASQFPGPGPLLFHRLLHFRRLLHIRLLHIRLLHTEAHTFAAAALAGGHARDRAVFAAAFVLAGVSEGLVQAANVAVVPPGRVGVLVLSRSFHFFSINY